MDRFRTFFLTTRLSPGLPRRLITMMGVSISVLIASPPLMAQWGPSKVEVASVVEENLAPTMRLVGTVHPQRRSTVASEVWGFVVEFPKDRGDVVRKGDLICRLRADQHRFARDEAAARVLELQGALSVAVAERRKAEFERSRIRRLSNTDGSTEKELVDSEANYEAAAAKVGQSEASVKSAEAILARLEDSLSRTDVCAPFDGAIVNKFTEVGSWVEQGGAVVEMIDLSTVRARLNVPESLIGFNPIGTRVTVSVDALDRDFEGSISRIIPDAEQQARTFPVDVDIPNSNGILKGGLFVRGAVASGPVGKRLVVPKDAVVTRGPTTYVFVVRGTAERTVAEMKPARIESEVLDRVAVTWEGVQAGDRVVIRGNESMMGPGPVIIMTPTPTPSPDGVSSTPATSQPAAGSNASSGGAQPVLPKLKPHTPRPVESSTKAG